MRGASVNLATETAVVRVLLPPASADNGSSSAVPAPAAAAEAVAAAPAAAAEEAAAAEDGPDLEAGLSPHDRQLANMGASLARMLTNAGYAATMREQGGGSSASSKVVAAKREERMRRLRCGWEGQVGAPAGWHGHHCGGLWLLGTRHFSTSHTGLQRSEMCKPTSPAAGKRRGAWLWPGCSPPPACCTTSLTGWAPQRRTGCMPWPPRLFMPPCLPWRCSVGDGVTGCCGVKRAARSALGLGSGQAVPAFAAPTPSHPSRPPKGQTPHPIFTYHSQGLGVQSSARALPRWLAAPPT